MPTVTSADGTAITFDRSGDGPPVVIVGGEVGDRSQQAPLAELLAARSSVYNYDRRGHGESGYTPPYSAEREADDLAAAIAQALIAAHLAAPHSLRLSEARTTTGGLATLSYEAARS
jgi:pimeloyl-ACP methyl ester carboxylesterase